MTKKPTLDQHAERESLHILEAQGYRVQKELPHEPKVIVPAKPGFTYRCAVVCCTHFGNVHQELGHVEEFCAYAETRGVEDFWHAGDAVDGSEAMHRDAPYEHFKHGYSAQANYMAEVLPRVNGRWRYILGNHEESFLKGDGGDVGDLVSAKRSDVEYLGRRAAAINVGPVRIYIMHGGGGTSYARSYKLQKRIEQFSDEDRPHVLLMGNYHVACHVPQYQNCEGFILPCFESQTPFLRGLGLNPVIGGLILEIEVGQSAPRSVKTEWRLYRPSGHLVGQSPKSDHS